MRDLVTFITGAGMIGCQTARELVQLGERPVLYDSHFQLESIDEIVDHTRTMTIQGDLMVLPELVAALDSGDADTIVHTAAVLGVAVGRRPTYGLGINIMGTVNVLEAARLLDISRIVFVSSSTVYAWNAVPTTLDEPVREDYPMKPGSLYAASKISCENIGAAYAKTYGLKFMAARFPMVFGPMAGMTGGFGGLLIRDLVMKPMGGKPVVLDRPFGEDEFLYSKDAGRALALMASGKQVDNDVFNVGMGKMYSFDEILEILRDLIPGANYTVRETSLETQSGGYYPRPQPFDISKVRRTFGFEPKYDMRQALSDLVDWARVRLAK